MKRIGYIKAFQVFVLFGLSQTVAHADGGIMRLRHVQGPFVITIFTTPEPVPHRAVDVSVLVQRRDSSDVILDASVDLLLTPPPTAAVKPTEPICGPSGVGFLSPESAGHNAPFSTPAARAQSSNKLMYAAAIEFGRPGDWTLDATVKSNGASERFSCRIPVVPPPRQLAGLWPYLAFPPFAIIAFALNQWLAHGLNRQRLPGVATHTVLASARLQRSLPVVLPLLGERVGVGTGAPVRPQGFMARRLA